MLVDIYPHTTPCMTTLQVANTRYLYPYPCLFPCVYYYPLSQAHSRHVLFPIYPLLTPHAFSPHAGSFPHLLFLLSQIFTQKSTKSHDLFFRKFTSQRYKILRKMCKLTQAYARHLRCPFLVTIYSRWYDHQTTTTTTHTTPATPDCERTVQRRTFRKIHKSKVWKSVV